MSYKKQELLTLREHLSSSPILVGSVLFIFLVFCVVLLYVFTFWVWRCGVCYDFRIKTMFDSSLPPVVCMRAPVLFTFFSLFAYSGVQHILCCVFALLVFVLCTLCCQFLWIVHSFLIAPSVFSNVYFPIELAKELKKKERYIDISFTGIQCVHFLYTIL